MYPAKVVAKAAGIKMPRLVNYIHRGVLVHCGVIPPSGHPRDIPALGAYEIAWIAKHVRASMSPRRASELFQVLRQKDRGAVHDRTEQYPIFAIISDLDEPSMVVTRYLTEGWQKLAKAGARMITMINVSAFFADVDAALYRADREFKEGGSEHV